METKILLLIREEARKQGAEYALVEGTVSYTASVHQGKVGSLEFVINAPTVKHKGRVE